MMLHRLCPACSTSLTCGRVLTPLSTFTPLVVRLSRAAYIPLRPRAGGRGENELIRSLPFGRVQLRAWTETGGAGFRANEATALTRRCDWSWERTQVLVLAKDTPLRVMRLKPQLELWPPELPPIGRRWRKLESFVPDPDVIL